MKRIIFLGSLIVAFTAHAQEDYLFRVLANKGANEVKSGNKWQPLKTGAQLKNGDELKVSVNSSVGLVSKGGRPLEIKEANIYKVIDLLGKVGTGTSVLNKYTDFILSSNSDEAKKNRLAATGAVHRGAGDAIKVFLPENQNSDLFNNDVFIRWQMTSGKGGAPFVVTLKDLFDVDLLKIETKETSLEIDLNDPKLANETTILVDVKSGGAEHDKSGQYLLKKLSAERREQVKKQLHEITADLKEETAFKKYLLAAFYEDQKLYIDAITCYEQAIKMDPENPTYKESFEEFLLRNKLKGAK